MYVFPASIVKRDAEAEWKYGMNQRGVAVPAWALILQRIQCESRAARVNWKCADPEAIR